MSTIRVALPVPLRQHFDYDYPFDTPIAVGCRVQVPFGNRQLVGIVWQLDPPDAHHANNPAAKPLKPVLTCLDQTPILAEELRELLSFAASYYHHPLGDVLMSALPALLREGRSMDYGQTEWLHAVDEPQSSESAIATLARAPKQLALWQQLQQAPMALEHAKHDFSATIIQQLVARGLANIQPHPLTAYTPLSTTAASKGLPLNPAQALAVAAIHQAQHQFSRLLLEGVTGSGKTEVYLQAITPFLQQGKQVLVIVPEIGLTPQTLARFVQRFEVPVLAWHSNMTDHERLRVWQHSQAGAAAIVIGTRSAIFLPMPALGLIIIDEEHDSSLKQHDGFRYHARDLAIKRAAIAKCPIVLGSATPSLESLHHALAGRYQHLRLPDRATAQQVPNIVLVDLKQQVLLHGLANQTRDAISQHLGRGQQVMLFLNRRGFAPALICHECGWLTECHRCSAFTTYHKQSRQLVCHHCGTIRAVPHQCGHCGSTQLAPVGKGTEQLEEQLSQLFPAIAISRLDRDSTRRKGSLQQHLQDIEQDGPRLIVGTQMLAKGHHFPRVTLVVVVDVDGALYSSDFRAAEHLAQLLTQVSGRAGRGGDAGTVLLQTHYPGHPTLQDIIQNGYHAFARSALLERQQTLLPPYQHMALFRSESLDSSLAEQFLQQLQQLIPTDAAVQWLGPIRSPLERKAGLYRWQLQLFSSQRPALHRLLPMLLQQLQAWPLSRKLKWTLDVDPIDLS